MKNEDQSLKGGALIPSVNIGIQTGNELAKQLTKMAKDLKRELRTLFEVKPVQSATDASLTDDSNRLISAQRDKWSKLFDTWAQKLAGHMVDRVEQNSAVTLGMSLREIAEKTSLERTSLMTPRIQEIMQASTEEMAGLIKTLPEEYLNDVQGAVMRSITTGKGLKDLVPELNRMYKSNTRKARNVALDQTRKAYNSLNTGRLKELGVKKFEWIHSGGGKEPRKLHLELNGKIFTFDKPPYIGDMYGQKIYGMPGQLPNCRCTMRPIVEFSED